MRLFVSKGFDVPKAKGAWEFAPRSKKGSYRRKNPSTGKWEYSQNPSLLMNKVEEDLASGKDSRLTEAKAEYLEHKVDKRSGGWRERAREVYGIPSESSSPGSMKLFLDKVSPGNLPIKDHAGLYLPPWVSDGAAHVWNSVLDDYADQKGWEKKDDVWTDEGRSLGPEDLDYRSLHHRFLEAVKKYVEKSLDAFDWFVSAVEEECDY